MKTQVPEHLEKYIQKQDSASYTPIEHATWRFILRQLMHFLTDHAHEFYCEGMEKSGVTIDEIPSIKSMGEKLKDYGWFTVPVSGFLPPSTFLQLQALGFLPIAKEIRTVQHIPYTPAPDIVHEAAGHAPFLAHEEYCHYLHQYAKISKKCIISSEDFQMYQAIRKLSDLKEDRNATQEQIDQAQKELDEAVENITYVSEAAKLARLYWWTAEYGLVGDLENPKLYGAGLLSSIGEAKSCLDPSVKKIPHSSRCIEYGFDITEKQPQLFVAEDFHHLIVVLNEVASSFAYQRGGIYGLAEAKRAKSVNTVEYNSGLQVSGVLANFLADADGNPCYLQFSSPTQIAYQDEQLPGHGTDYHAHGFGSPVGLLQNEEECLSGMSPEKLAHIGIIEGRICELKFASGVEVKGLVKSILRRDSKNLIIAFTDCTVRKAEKILFQPEWGVFDMAIGSEIPSVFGGPADEKNYGEVEDHVSVEVPNHDFSDQDQKLFAIYQEVRDMRSKTGVKESDLESIYSKLAQDFPNEWLLKVELLELAHKIDASSVIREKLLADLNAAAAKYPELAMHIQGGIDLARFMKL